MPFQPGLSGNPNGRPTGIRNKRTEKIFKELAERGDRDPADILSAIASDQTEPKELRVRAASELMGYMHGKMGTIPAPRFVADPFEVPQFTTIDQAEDYLAEIPQRVGRGELDFQSALDFSNMVRNWIEAKLAHTNTDLKVAAQGTLGDATIRIEGGLPQLPGTNINMSNELVSNGHTIDHLPSPESDRVEAVIPPHGSVEPAKIDSPGGQSEGQE